MNITFLNNIPLSEATPIIKQSVAKYFKLNVDDLEIKTRKLNIVVPRQIAHFLATFCKDATLEKIGELYGNKDYTTIIHSRDEILKYITTVNNKIVDNEIYRALHWIEFYMKQGIETERIKMIKSQNRQKRINYHIKSVFKRYNNIKNVN